MNLRGGVIIIGSLLWDNAERNEWRCRSLASLDTKIPIKLKIRYGRESGEKRRGTYTMIFSNHRSTGDGQGFAVEFQQPIRNEDDLRREAQLLARSEGIWNGNARFLAKDWGAVALIANPNAKNVDALLGAWRNIFNEGRCSNGRHQFHHALYSFHDDTPVIDQEGMLQVEWLPEMDTVDFLLATPTVPNPRRPLSVEEIATRMIERNYTTYFESNSENNIRTFQDNEILELLAL